MLQKKVDLYKEFGVERPENADGYLSCYVIEPSEEYTKDRLRPAMLVLPGGGYYRRSDREAEPVCFPYLSAGFSCFVLEYSVTKTAPETAKYPVPLLEAAMAVAYLHRHKKEYFLNGQVAVIGFSAGGHLAASISTLYGDEPVKEIFGESYLDCRPEATVLSYPVISFIGDTERGTCVNSTRNNAALYQKLSLETQVDEKTPPAFIWTTAEDKVVPPVNSLLYANALIKNGVACELHVYERGAHGTSLNTEETAFKDGTGVYSENQTWVPFSIAFLKRHGFTFSNREEKE